MLIIKTVVVIGENVMGTKLQKGDEIKWNVPIRYWEGEEVDVEIWEDEDSTTFSCSTGEVTRQGLLLVEGRESGQLLPFSNYWISY